MNPAIRRRFATEMAVADWAAGPDSVDGVVYAQVGRPWTLSSEAVVCRRQRVLAEGCSDVGGSMRVQGARSLSSECQTAIPLCIMAVACSSQPRF